MMRRLLCALVMAVLVPSPSLGQEHPDVRAALQANEALDYEAAVDAAHRALSQRLTRHDRILLYELLGFAYGALDSTRQAVEAFRELIFLDPDREPDPLRVSPRITSLYASALGQVLVVRRVRVDSSAFVAGRGGVPVRFELSRPGRVVSRAVGPSVDIRFDSLSVGGEGRVEWSASTADGAPVPPGRYQLILEASAGRDEFARQVLVDVRHGAVDTLHHVSNLPGYALQDEYERPPRNWRPLGIAALYTAVAAGAAIALENTGLGAPDRAEVGGIGAAVLLTGFVMSLRKPDPRPVPANVLYNRLLREQIAQRNVEIAEENADRRRQVMITVVPVRGHAADEAANGAGGPR